MKIGADATLCRDCQACTLACSLYHEGECSLSLARLAIHKDMAKYEFEIVLCRHCDPPECMLACPEDAIRLDDQRIAHIDDEDCIRCGACETACPYDAIVHNAATDRYLKCDMCTGRDEGPLCVQVCPVGALTLVG